MGTIGNLMHGGFMVKSGQAGENEDATNTDADVAACVAAQKLGLNASGSPIGPKGTSVKTANYIVQTGDCGGVIQCGTDALTITLPTAPATGFYVKVQNTGADGNNILDIRVPTGVSVFGEVAAVEFSGTASKGIVNTKATAKQGDWCELMYDGANWWSIGGVGVWATHA